MCTVTWILRPQSYELLFNRDERRTRGRGDPPRIVEVAAVRAIAPRDSDAGGSWIGVNEFGLSLCVLNRYQDGEDPEPSRLFTSRGVLLASMLDIRSHEEFRERLHASDFRVYRPFSLASFAPDRPPIMCDWNGRTQRIIELERRMMPLVSSGYEFDSVAASRRALLQSRIAGRSDLDPALLLGYHRSHLPDRGPYSVCMHRDDAGTVSFSRIEVDATDVAFSYTDGPPCSGKALPVVRLSRASC